MSSFIDNKERTRPLVYINGEYAVIRFNYIYECIFNSGNILSSVGMNT